MELECECEEVCSVAMHSACCGVVNCSPGPERSCIQSVVPVLPVSELVQYHDTDSA